MAIVRVQGNARGYDTDNSIAVTMGSAPISGNVLVAAVVTEKYPTVTVSSIDQTGVTWTKQASKTYTYDTSIDTEIWFGVVGAGASANIVVTLSGTADSIADVCEYSGVLTSSFLDKTATNSGRTANPTTGTTATTTQNDELWIGAIGHYGYAQATPTNDFTLLDGAKTNHPSLAYLEKIVSATGTAASGTTSTAAEWASCIATFFAAAAAAAPPTAVLRRLLMGVGL